MQRRRNDAMGRLVDDGMQLERCDEIRTTLE